MGFDVYGYLVRRTEDRQAPELPTGFPVELGAEDDADTVPEQVSPVIEEKDDGLGYAEGQTFAIEYVDAQGRESRRRITVWSICEGSGGVPCLYAKCHERQAMRSFRTDRIRAVIDLNGEIFEPPTDFLVDAFGINRRLFESRGILAKHLEPAVPSEWTLLRRRVRDQAALLSIMSQSDGVVRPAELAIIERHCRLLGSALEPSADELAKLSAYILRLRPSPTTIERALTAMMQEDLEAVAHFLDAALSVAEADGRIHPDERQLLAELCYEITGRPYEEIAGPLPDAST